MQGFSLVGAQIRVEYRRDMPVEVLIAIVLALAIAALVGRSPTARVIVSDSLRRPRTSVRIVRSADGVKAVAEDDDEATHPRSGKLTL